MRSIIAGMGCSLLPRQKAIEQHGTMEQQGQQAAKAHSALSHFSIQSDYVSTGILVTLASTSHVLTLL
jgi:hypothetical protein